MPSLNGINVKDAEFTAMQEKATALISKRSFVDNINFTSHLDIIKDKKTVQGLKEIFVKDRTQLFNYKSPFSQKIEENWFKTYFVSCHCFSVFSMFFGQKSIAQSSLSPGTPGGPTEPHGAPRCTVRCAAGTAARHVTLVHGVLRCVTV